MTTLKVRIETFDQSIDAAVRAAGATVGDGLVAESVLSFPSWDALHHVLTPGRLDIVRAMRGRGALSLAELASRLHKEPVAVGQDVDLLLRNGVIDRAENDQVVFPYDRIHLQFEIDAAA